MNMKPKQARFGVFVYHKRDRTCQLYPNKCYLVTRPELFTSIERGRDDRRRRYYYYYYCLNDFL